MLYKGKAVSETMCDLCGSCIS